MIFDHLRLSNFEKNSGIEVFCKTLKQLLKFIYSNIYLVISICLINSFDRWIVLHCGSTRYTTQNTHKKVMGKILVAGKF